MIKVKILLLKIAKSGLKIIYALIKFFPVKKKVTLISRQSDTPSVDFLLLKEEIERCHPDCEIKIMAKRIRKNPSYVMHTVAQLYHIATSRNVVIDSYCIPISVLNHKKDLRIIQMWHSLGSMKHFGYAMIGKEEGHSKEVAEVMRMHKNYTHVLISSYDFIQDFLIGFRVPEEKILEIPLPRADILSDATTRIKKRAAVIKRYPQLANKINILYCPTFRKEHSLEDNDKIKELIELIDYKKYNFIYKPHVLSTLEINDERIITADAEDFDIMFATDYMISDYSSVIYEAGLLNIPVYLYAYDWNDYKKKRTFNLDLEKDIPTIFTDDPKEIIDCIVHKRFDEVAFGAFVKKNVKMTDDKCVSKIVELMELDID